jgi:hypothetical protein
MSAALGVARDPDSGQPGDLRCLHEPALASKPLTARGVAAAANTEDPAQAGRFPLDLTGQLLNLPEPLKDLLGFRARDSDSDRTAYSPDEEIRGVATFTGGTLLIRELTLSRTEGLSARSLQTVRLGALRDHILADLREHKLLEQLTTLAARAEHAAPRLLIHRSWVE